MERQCGDCQLCCKLLPIARLHKPAGKRCEHQRHGKGCMIYERRPMDCATWVCRWLMGGDTADLRRPDRSHYVIDMMPDYVELDGVRVPVIQIWVDRDHPDCYSDPALRAYLARWAETGTLALIRFNSSKAHLLIAPNVSPDGQWHEIDSGISELEHSIADIVALATPHGLFK